MRLFDRANHTPHADAVTILGSLKARRLMRAIAIELFLVRRQGMAGQIVSQHFFLVRQQLPLFPFVHFRQDHGHRFTRFIHVVIATEQSHLAALLILLSRRTRLQSAINDGGKLGTLGPKTIHRSSLDQ